MSTEAILAALVTSGALVLWMPELDADQTVHRRIYMRPDVHRWVESRPTDVKGRAYFASLRQFLKDFVTGESFDNPNKLKNLDVDDLKKPDQGYYAFRLQRADPKARIFGGFPCANIMVCTHYKHRPGINWGVEKGRIQTIWDSQLKTRMSIGGVQKTVQLDRINDQSRTDLTNNNRRM